MGDNPAPPGIVTFTPDPDLDKKSIKKKKKFDKKNKKSKKYIKLRKIANG